MKLPEPLRRKDSRNFFFWFSGRDGQRRRVSTGTDNLPEARKFIRDYVVPLALAKSVSKVAEVAQEMLAELEAVELEEAWDIWRQAPKSREPSKRTLREKQSVWEDWRAFAAEQGVTMCRDCSKRLAREYVHQLRTKGRFRRLMVYARKPSGKRGARAGKVRGKNPVKKLSAKSCNDYLMSVRQVFDAVEEMSSVPNPFAGIPRLIQRSVSREAFSREELAALLKKADGFTRPLVVLGACTGLRLGDIVTLRWSEVEGAWIRREMAKTGRVVKLPVMPRVATLLAGLARESEYVLPRHAQLYLGGSASVIHRAMRGLIEATEVAGEPLVAVDEVSGRDRKASLRGMHSLRHSFVWMAAEAGVPISAVQAIVGHMAPAMTRLYADHATEGSALRAVAAIGDPFEARKGALQAMSLEELQAELARRLEEEG